MNTVTIPTEEYLNLVEDKYGLKVSYLKKRLKEFNDNIQHKKYSRKDLEF